MKLLSIELANFRKFRKPITVSGFRDALNIVVEPNETGKSTLLLNMILQDINAGRGESGIRCNLRHELYPSLRCGLAVCRGPGDCSGSTHQKPVGIWLSHGVKRPRAYDLAAGDCWGATSFAALTPQPPSKVYLLNPQTGYWEYTRAGVRGIVGP